MLDESERTNINLLQEDNVFLKKYHQNRSEAIRILIKIAKERKTLQEMRQILQNIAIGCISLAIFFIYTIWINSLFIVLAFIIFIYEAYDIVRFFKNGGTKKT